MLAAGGASRMGRPKQLLRYRGRSLIERAVDAALGARCHAVHVVVGAEAEAVTRALRDRAVRIVENPRWRDGIATSIAAGVADCVAEPASGAPEGVLLLVADQPHLDAAVLDALIDAFSGAPDSIVASGYAGDVGTPALFGREHLEELRALEGDRGARVLLQRHRERLRVVDFPAGAVDLDTPADWSRLTGSSR